MLAACGSGSGANGTLSNDAAPPSGDGSLGSGGSGGGAGSGGSETGAPPSGPGADAAGADGTPNQDGGSGPGVDGAAPTGPYSWNNVAIGGGGFVSGIVFSPVQSGLAYARTDVGGFYRRTSATGPWVPLTDSFPMSQGNDMGGESIAPDPTDASIVYAAGGMYESNGNGVILRSTNQGTTWSIQAIDVPMGGNDLGRGMGERLAVDPNNHSILLFGTRGKGLYKSTDSGTTWAQVTSFPATGDINVPLSYGGMNSFGLPVVIFDKAGGSASGSTNIYVAAASTQAGSNVYSTTDGGTTWGLVAGGPTGLMAHHASLGSDGTLWLAYSNDYGPYNVSGAVVSLPTTLSGQVWKYATGTGAWTNVTPPNANWGGMAGGISVDAENAQHVVVSTLDWYAPDRLLATTNGGTTWTVVGQPPVSYDPDVSTYDDNGAAYWLVGGADIGTGATNWVEAVALDPFSSNHVLYGTGAGIWESTDIQATTGTSGQGVTWTFEDMGLEETVPIYLMPTIKGAFLGAIGDLGGMRNATLNAYSASGEYSNPVFSNTNGIDFAESDTNFVVRVGNSGAAATDVAYSNDNGVTWTPCASAPPGYSTDNEMQSVAVAADGSRFVVSPYTGHGNPAFTLDNGTSWTTISTLPSGAMLASDRVTAGTFYATSGGTLYASTDGGATFAAANTFTGNGAPRTVFGKAGEVWVAADGGDLYQFTASGATKTQIATATSVYGVGFGMAASGQSHPAVFIIGTVSGQYGFFRSDDGAGATWTRVNDDSHQYGYLQNNYIAGDENVYGRVYLTTGGRGYIYGDPNP